MPFDDQLLLLELPFTCALVALAAIDLERRLLPNRIVLPLAAWGVVATAVVERTDLAERLVAGGMAFALLFAAAMASPGGIGMGDVKLAAAMGLYLGPSVVPALAAAFLSGSLAGLALVAREGAAARKLTLPFGVFLALGGIVALLAGPQLIELWAARLGPQGPE